MPKRIRNLQGFTFIAVFLIIVSLALVLFFIFKGQNKVFQPVVDEVSKVFISVTPTPFPFQELTIPYLRSGSYDSSLGEMQKVGENGNYTSYVTSYDSDGLKIFGLLTIPKSSPSTSTQDGERKYPAIVFVHGYIPPQNYKTQVNYVSWTNYLAGRGFVVFKIDLRGHGNSEGEPEGGYYSGDYVIDTLNAYNTLYNSDFVNTDAIGLWGHSMAGNIVLRAFAAKQTIPAVVIWAGAGYTYSDLQDYRISDNSYQPPAPDSKRAKKRAALREAYGEFSPDHWFWKQVPATNYLENVKGAIQLHHAVDDSVVSIDYSRNLNTILNATQIFHELIEYPSGGHNLTGASFNRALETTADFFEEQLK
jgi:dipeptidyl aminopeptidase/acylaminoacyl peptidase